MIKYNNRSMSLAEQAGEILWLHNNNEETMKYLLDTYPSLTKEILMDKYNYFNTEFAKLCEGNNT